MKLYCLILFLVQGLQTKSETDVLHRQRRYLLFPYQGTFKTVYSFAIPWKLGPRQDMGVGWNFQFQYGLPYNTSAFENYPQTVTRRARYRRNGEVNGLSDRAIFYQGVESLLDGQGINGKECLLKTICENAGYTHFDDDGGLLGQILHVFLAPNNQDSSDPALDPVYSDAQKAGEFGADCSTLYQCNMERSLFNWFSINGN